MHDFRPVPLIGTGQDLMGDIRQWVRSDPMGELVDAFGGVRELIFVGDDVREWLRALDEFSVCWDSRKGGERNLAGSLDLTPDQEQLALRASEALGLRSAAPPRSRRYDHVFLLGGLVRACLTRPAYAAELMRSGAVTAGAVTALGGHREFRGDEFELAKRAGHPALTNEFDALDLGTRLAFGLEEPISREGGGAGNSEWTINTYDPDGSMPIRVAAAPSSDPAHRRANTADTYAWFAERVARLPAGSSVLAITTAIYVPAQHAAALRMLGVPHGLAVETVGVTPGVLPELAQSFSASQYLQEVRSAIRSIRDLVDSITG
ncbi:MAG: hypothetical protein QM747_14830 [Nocardioides sp.]